MGRRGRKRRLDVESEYWLLLGSGVGPVEACKRLPSVSRSGEARSEPETLTRGRARSHLPDEFE